MTGSVSLVVLLRPLRGEKFGIKFVTIRFSSLNENIGREMRSRCCFQVPFHLSFNTFQYILTYLNRLHEAWYEPTAVHFTALQTCNKNVAPHKRGEFCTYSDVISGQDYELTMRQYLFEYTEVILYRTQTRRLLETFSVQSDSNT